MHVRCPHCHHSIELVEDSQLSDVSCPSCGSNFNLLADVGTNSDKRAEHRTIGHFRLIEQVGVGAFGSVWKARDRELDRTVAVKIPRKGQLDQTETEQFLREARSAAQLKHPGIVAVHEVGRQDGQVYIVSDFVQGINLKDWLSEQRLTSRDAAELCAKIAEALHHAHEQGVVHRDVKPGNIMMDGEGEPHVMDFGLAKRDAGEITMTIDGQILGTPAYMSPEQARGGSHQADGRTDIYSLGVILYELLTDERPFRGDKVMLIYQILSDEPMPPRRINSHCPKDLETICLKCLEKDPGLRFQTAQELADDLTRWLGDEPILARPIGPVERSGRWVRRNRVLTALFVSLAAGIGGSLYFANEWRKEAAFARRQIVQAGQAREEARTAEDKKAKATQDLQHRLTMTAAQELERGLALCERGEIGQGVLWLAHALETLPPGEETLAKLIRRNLSAWGPQLNTVRMQFQTAGQVVGFSADGATAMAAPGFQESPHSQLWDVDTGKKAGSPLQLGDSRKSALTRPLWCSNDRKSILSFYPGRPASNGNPGQMAEITRSNFRTPQRIRLVMRYAIQFGGSRFTAFSPDGRSGVMASSSRQEGGKVKQRFHIQSFSAGKPVVELETSPDAGYLSASVFSPDGKTVLLGMSGNHSATRWDTSTGKQAGKTLQLDGPLTSASFSRDGRILVTADGTQRVRIWDGTTGEPIRSSFVDQKTGRPLNTPLEEHNQDRISEVWLSPDGRFLLTGSVAEISHVWNLDTGRSIGQPMRGRVTAAFFSEDGKSVVTAIENRVRVWTIAGVNDEGQLSQAGSSPPLRLPDWKTSAPARILLWAQLATGTELTADGTLSVLDSPTWRNRRELFNSQKNNRKPE